MQHKISNFKSLSAKEKVKLQIHQNPIKKQLPCKNRPFDYNEVAFSTNIFLRLYIFFKHSFDETGITILVSGGGNKNKISSQWNIE